MSFHCISAWSPPCWLKAGHAGVRNGGYLLHHPSHSHLVPVPCGSCMVFFKPGNFFSPVTPHIVSVPLTCALEACAIPSPAFPHLGFCPFPTHLLLEGIKNFLQDELKPPMLQPGLCSGCIGADPKAVPLPCQAAACPAL